jgi:glycosyltransferase involved in cell wall biosynthesis
MAKISSSANSCACVSVVIPCYNAADSIARAVESLHHQDFRNIEIIVIDDGSTDATPEVIPSLPCVKSRRTLNQGVCAARNTGLDLATGEFVLFLDADDYLEQGSLAEWISDAAEADVVFGPFAHQTGQLRTAGLRPEPSANAVAVACAWLDGLYTPTCSVLWRTSFLRVMGGWAEDVLRNDDGEIAVRALINGARVHFAQAGCGVYVHHEKAGRISLRSGRNVSHSEYSALDRLWALAKARHPDAMKASFAGAFYQLAYRCFATGVRDIGELALSRARQLGLKGHVGSLRHRMLCGLVGLRRKLGMTGIVKGRRIMCTAQKGSK